jgi:hypothetical protein
MVCEFSFCKRDANFVADYLSRETDSLPCIWVDDPHSFVMSLLVEDISLI